MVQADSTTLVCGDQEPGKGRWQACTLRRFRRGARGASHLFSRLSDASTYGSLRGSHTACVCQLVHHYHNCVLSAFSTNSIHLLQSLRHNPRSVATSNCSWSPPTLGPSSSGSTCGTVAATLRKGGRHSSTPRHPPLPGGLNSRQHVSFGLRHWRLRRP